MTDTKAEVSDVKVVSEGSGPAKVSRDNASYVEKQTRTRRLFTLPQLFAFSLMYFTTWAGMGTSMWYALVNGGPAAYLFNFLIVMIGVLAQAASMGELASILPIAGAQYYWTYQWSPLKYQRFLTWMQGWATWLGYVACLAGALNGAAFGWEGAIIVNFPGYDNGGWKTCVIVLGMLAVYTVMNVWMFPVIPWLELVSGILNVFTFFIVLVTLWVMSPRNSPEFLIATSKSSGWDSDFISWNVGMLTQIWMFIGFESVVHMGEETKNAKRTAPLAMFWSILFNGVLALIMVITYVICMPPLEDTINAAFPFYYLIETSTGSKAVTTVIVTLKSICSIGIGMSVFSSTSRITWAWARDGGLPSYFGYVDGKHRVPIRAVILTSILVALLALLNIGRGTYIALGAISSLSSLSLYFSYMIVLGVIVYARCTTGIPKADWSLGRCGMPINVFALVYTVYTMIWLPFPTTVPVDAANMNYAGPVFVAVMGGAVGAWFVWGKTNWPGPNQAVVDIVLKNASL